MQRPVKRKVLPPLLESPGQMMGQAKNEWVELVGYVAIACGIFLSLALIVLLAKVISEMLWPFFSQLGRMMPVLAAMIIVLGFTLWRYFRREKDPGDLPHYGGSEGDK